MSDLVHMSDDETRALMRLGDAFVPYRDLMLEMLRRRPSYLHQPREFERDARVRLGMERID